VGFQSVSYIMTVSAPVSVMPRAPARVESRYTPTLLAGELKREISYLRLGDVEHMGFKGFGVQELKREISHSRLGDVVRMGQILALDIAIAKWDHDILPKSRLKSRLVPLSGLTVTFQTRKQLIDFDFGGYCYLTRLVVPSSLKNLLYPEP
jgi:hypothetical protein